MMWGALLGGLSRLFGTKAGEWILSALAFLGLYWASSEFLVGPFLDQIKSSFSGAPAVLLQTVAYLRIDQYITIVLSAYATAAASGALKMRKRP